jgi:predicted SAM-dependent methyltransferase
MKKLNVGCNKVYKEGWVNLDIDKSHRADVYHNLNHYPYPFKDREFDYILASHVMEHLDDPEKALRELKRILNDNGELCIVVPHFTNPMAYSPKHKAFYSFKTVNHICNDMHVKEKNLVFTPKYKFMELFARKFPIFYENTPLRMFPAMEIRVVLTK